MCKFNGKYFDKVTLKYTTNSYIRSGYKKKNKKTFIDSFIPLDFSKVFVKPIKRAMIFTLPQLKYKGQSYNFYQVDLIISDGPKEYIVLTKPNSKEVLVIFSTGNIHMRSKGFSFEKLFKISKKSFEKTDLINKSLKDKEYKNDDFEPYEILDNSGGLKAELKKFIY
ncbi:hypothetical protein [Winogradskyella pacifica]|uniref:hypothetical protein n=1 Tax=Winogradskyella pacifica TaxID=664642 RepID=UPI0015CB97A9|nr:hypothetical protein [Winogradskyella pacifica]